VSVDESVARNIAPLGRRFVASLIDAAVFLPLLLAAGIGGFKLYMSHLRRSSSDGERPELGSGASSRLQAWGTGRWRWAILVGGSALEVSARNWRSPGARLLGLRRVDVHAGGPVPIRSALVTYGVRTAWRESTRRLLAPIEKRSSQRAAAFRAQAREIRRPHAGDRETKQRALAEESRADGRNCLTLLVPAVISVVAMQAPALWSPLKQTIPDRLAGIAVIKD
jgi:hypothetical protein